MRVVLQRVDRAEARLDGEPVASIGDGLVLFVGIGRDDTAATAEHMARKLANLRVMEAPGSKFGRSLVDAGGAALCLAQVTLMADTSRGRRPNFSHAAAPDRAEELLGRLCAVLESEGVREVVQGPFGERLVVDARNRGPFTVALESREHP